MTQLDQTRHNQTLADRIAEKIELGFISVTTPNHQMRVRSELAAIIRAELESASVELDALTEEQESRTVVSGIVRALRGPRKSVGDIVSITEGKYEGLAGYFDDETEDGQAIIYLGKWDNGYVVVSKDSLAEPTVKQKAAYSKRACAPDFYD